VTPEQLADEAMGYGIWSDGRGPELRDRVVVAVREAVAAERERCAGIVAGWGVNAPVPEWGRIQRDLLREIREGGGQ
jgi:hypothetical protein